MFMKKRSIVEAAVDKIRPIAEANLNPNQISQISDMLNKAGLDAGKINDAFKSLGIALPVAAAAPVVKPAAPNPAGAGATVTGNGSTPGANAQPQTPTSTPTQGGAGTLGAKSNAATSAAPGVIKASGPGPTQPKNTEESLDRILFLVNRLNS